MIRYASYGSLNYRTQSAQTIYLDPLEAQYRELQELRDRVRRAEVAIAERGRSRGKRKAQDQMV